MALITFPEILDELTRMTNPFDFTRSGLGELILDVTFYGIVENCISELDPEGVPWPRLSHGYDQWKQTVAPGQPIGRLFDVMLDPTEVRGERAIGPQYAMMRYGVSDVAKIHATKFQEGGAVTGTNQPERWFFGITTEAARDATQIFDLVFDTFLT